MDNDFSLSVTILNENVGSLKVVFPNSFVEIGTSEEQRELLTQRFLTFNPPH